MSINFKSYPFDLTPTISKKRKATDRFSIASSIRSLKARILKDIQLPSSPNFQILPFRKGYPMIEKAGQNQNDDSWPGAKLNWIDLANCKRLLGLFGSQLTADVLVYLGFSVEHDTVYWGIDVSDADNNVVQELSNEGIFFFELRKLIIATNWTDPLAMEMLAIASYARALLKWHSISHFCGHCRERLISKEAGRKKQCSNRLCAKIIYPLLDPVAFMLVIDRADDCALLGRKANYVPEIWTCLVGFMEPGESLEEAVRRETLEETGIEVEEVVYQCSQLWPVGPGTMPFLSMIGFFAYAKSFYINVDDKVFEDAHWLNRKEVKEALKLTDYEKVRITAAAMVGQMCKGVEKVPAYLNNELDPMFIPGPSAIGHHLIFSWVFQDNASDAESSS